MLTLSWRLPFNFQVHVIGALPLKTLSRIYGALNEYTLPVWFRVPGYKLYGYIFGVNFDEVENDLQSYTSLSDFFMRRLKPGSREPEEAPFVSCLWAFWLAPSSGSPHF